MVLLKVCPNADRARAIEKKVVGALVRIGIELANFNHVVDKSSAESMEQARALWRFYCEEPPADDDDE